MNIKGELFSLETPVVMGILNLTPDSFYDGGALRNNDDILQKVGKMLEDGASIIDVGAVSTRPKAVIPDLETEYSRLKKPLSLIRKHFQEAVISVDTFRSEIAERVVNEFSVDIINDIFAGSYDEKMFEIINKLRVPYIIMHIQGTPENMQDNPQYKDVTNDILFFFSEKIQKLREIGVKDVIVDPGFGFGKTTAHNYELLNRLDEFEIIGLPILVGVSRKSMINKVLNCRPSESLNGTSVLNTIALLKGAKILRVHDVKEAVEAIKLVSSLKQG
ncbi:MAG: dihydropteroate synthase [Bacteroidales bacterium]|nr:dihydropteroate synthase [Bacteroidales bacterium]